MAVLTGSVGQGGTNNAQDVLLVETYLMRHRRWLDPLPEFSPDSNFTPETAEAIKRFQLTAAALYKDDVDGMVQPGSFTFRRLEAGQIPFPKHPVFDAFNMCLDHGVGISQADWDKAAQSLGCEVNAIKAVAEQETGKAQGAFDGNGRPSILYERHKFSEYSGHVWDATHRDISSKSQSTNNDTERDKYGKFSAQYRKLYRAATLDENAALQSASWGKFQMLGDKYDECGFGDVADFVSTLMESEAKHLEVFTMYISGNSGLLEAIRKKDWAKFARLYNGKGYAANHYDTEMAAHYAKFQAQDAAKIKAGSKK